MSSLLPFNKKKREKREREIRLERMFAIRQRTGGGGGGKGEKVGNEYPTTFHKGLLMVVYFGGLRLAYWVVNHSRYFNSE